MNDPTSGTDDIVGGIGDVLDDVMALDYSAVVAGRHPDRNVPYFPRPTGGASGPAIAPMPAFVPIGNGHFNHKGANQACAPYDYGRGYEILRFKHHALDRNLSHKGNWPGSIAEYSQPSYARFAYCENLTRGLAVNAECDYWTSSYGFAAGPPGGFVC